MHVMLTRLERGGQGGLPEIVLGAAAGGRLRYMALGSDAETLRADLAARVPGATPAHEDDPFLAGALDAVARYVKQPGSVDLSAIPVDDSGATDFQRRVWSALRAIPIGQTRTYGQIASALGLGPGSSRAVGAACGANPCAIVVPCHRAVGADGSLIGYRWGVETKRALLELESRACGLFASA